ncbi:hypothetical protein [Nafulsella turpanensis]|uniref:hypothetical protein n=1 Tax=Nafulsella turpanensis TaxID=1265690 RepID=UPI00034D62DD|nr:hypothetical protein [Nafulsella turpanensis]
MKYLLILFMSTALTLGLQLESEAQSPALAFNRAANLFIEGDNQQALRNVNAALRRYPNDPQLKALKEKLEKKQEEEKKKQQQQEQQKKDQQDKKEQQQDGQSSEEEKKEEGQEEKKPQEGEEKSKEEKEQQEKEGEKPSEEEEKEGKEKQEQQAPTPSETEKRLEQMDISPEKARMILEAMKSKEVQYLQQKKRRAPQRTDDGKPDW